MKDGENIPENYFYDKFGEKTPKSKTRLKTSCKYYLVILVLILFFLWFIVSAPSDFKENTVFQIDSGSSLTSVSKKLEERSIIRSPMFFRLSVGIFGDSRGIKAGSYIFEEPHNVINVALRLIKGKSGFSPVTVVIPEGTSVLEIAEIVKRNITNFDDKKFLELAEKKEGYLFPDSYILTLDTTPEQLLKNMQDNFDKKIASVKESVVRFNKPLPDIINMASIVEEEGRSFEVRRMVAGILWRRLEIGMPLQVDATFKYINGKTTFELTTEDLIKDSPYNTYTRKGLPPTAITNPGLDSIRATITPIKSNYLYYLTDKNGVMHYAVTHSEHVANKERYLR